MRTCVHRCSTMSCDITHVSNISSAICGPLSLFTWWSFISQDTWSFVSHIFPFSLNRQEVICHSLSVLPVPTIVWLWVSPCSSALWCSLYSQYMKREHWGGGGGGGGVPPQVAFPHLQSLQDRVPSVAR